MRYLIICLLFLSACVPSDNMRKRIAHRKIEKAKFLYPEAFDTIRIHDTIVVEHYSHDTVSQIIMHDSTVIIDNERMVLKYFYDTLRQEIHHEAECKEIEEVVVQEVPKYVTEDKFENEWVYLAVFSGLVLVVTIILKFF